MPRVPVNLAEVKPLEALPPGTYSVVILAMEDKKSKNGKDMVKITFQCTEEGLSNKFFTNILLEESSMFKWKELYDACRIPYGADGFDTDDLKEAELKVTVDQELYEDKLQNKVKNFLKLS